MHRSSEQAGILRRPRGDTLPHLPTVLAALVLAALTLPGTLNGQEGGHPGSEWGEGAPLLATPFTGATPDGSPLDEPEEWPPARLHAGLAVGAAQPVGEFQDYVRAGIGIQGFFRAALDPRGLISLKLDAGFLTYGRETQRVCLSATVGCRIEVDLTTQNNIFVIGAGPELGLSGGPFRAYGTLLGGFTYFHTDSSVEGTQQDDPFASTRNHGDGGFSWTGGGGLQLQVSGGRTPISLDLGVTYYGNGQREYLTRGGIIDHPDGSIELELNRSDADFLLWRLGVSVGLRQAGN